MPKQPLYRFDVCSLVHQPSRQAVAQVVKAETLTLFQLYTGGDGRWSKMIGGQHTARSRLLSLASRTREDPVGRPCVHRLPVPAAQAVGKEIGEGHGGFGVICLQMFDYFVLYPD